MSLRTSAGAIPIVGRSVLGSAALAAPVLYGSGPFGIHGNISKIARVEPEECQARRVPRSVEV
jgi:hypothetical protein